MKSGIRKALILLFVFLAAGAAVFYFTRAREEPETIYDGMSQASLPVVYSLYNGERINRMYGYTLEMKEEYMRDSVTPLGNDGQMTVLVDCFGNTLTGISYEVRDAGSGRLIEATAVDHWSGSGTESETRDGGPAEAERSADGAKNGGTVQAVLPIQKLIEEGKEYLAELSDDRESSGRILLYPYCVQRRLSCAGDD